MIRILVDSTADFNAEEKEKFNLAVVPLMVNMGGNQYRDGIDMPLDEFFDKLAKAKTLPTTSQPNPEAFKVEFEKAKAAGDTLICIIISSVLSGTMQSAVIAKDEVDYDNIYIVDSKIATIGTRLLVMRAMQRIEEGFSAMQIVSDLEAARENLRLFAVVDELKYFKMGGRLSAASAFAGELLGIKPVLTLEDGKLGPCGKARGFANAQKLIFEKVEECGGIDESWPYCLGYTKTPAAADEIYSQTCKLVEKAPERYPIGTVIGTHAGPNARAIAFFAKKAGVKLMEE